MLFLCIRATVVNLLFFNSFYCDTQTYGHGDIFSLVASLNDYNAKVETYA